MAIKVPLVAIKLLVRAINCQLMSQVSFHAPALTLAGGSSCRVTLRASRKTPLRPPGYLLLLSSTPMRATLGSKKSMWLLSSAHGVLSTHPSHRAELPSCLLSLALLWPNRCGHYRTTSLPGPPTVSCLGAPSMMVMNGKGKRNLSLPRRLASLPSARRSGRGDSLLACAHTVRWLALCLCRCTLWGRRHSVQTVERPSWHLVALFCSNSPCTIHSTEPTPHFPNW